MANSTHDLILTGKNLTLGSRLRSLVEEKFAKLFAHEPHIIRIRVELEYNSNVSGQNEHIAKGHIEIRGNDIVVTTESDDLAKSIDLLVERLDRQLRRRSRLRRVKRKQTHEVDIPATIPKSRRVA